MRTLKFKLNQPFLLKLAAVNYLSGPLGKQKGHVKRSCLSLVIGRFRSILFVSVFQGSLAVIVLIDSSKKPNRQLGFELQSSYVIERHNNLINFSLQLNTKRQWMTVTGQSLTVCPRTPVNFVKESYEIRTTMQFAVVC